MDLNVNEKLFIELLKINNVQRGGVGGYNFVLLFSVRVAACRWVQLFWDVLKEGVVNFLMFSCSVVTLQGTNEFPMHVGDIVRIFEHIEVIIVPIWIGITCCILNHVVFFSSKSDFRARFIAFTTRQHHALPIAFKGYIK